MKNVLIFSLFFLVALSLNSQDLNTAKLDSLFVLVNDNQKIMGSLSIFRDGKEIYAKSIGYADIESKMESHHETRYRIGSITKTFTAALILQLIEQGKLSLDSRLEEFYPSLPNASEITIDDLMSHQSGLFNFTNAPAYLEYMEKPKTKEELLEIFKVNGTVFKSKEKTEYSNTNYVLLTFIAEEITGMSFPQLLSKKISKPLGLENTYYGGKINTSDSEANSYKKRSEWKLHTETDMSIPQGAGAIVSTPFDLNKFFTSLFLGEIIALNSLGQMKGNEKGIGRGLFKFPFKEKEMFGHTGGIDGFSSFAIYYPQEKLSFAFTANGTEMGVNEFMSGILSIVFDQEYDLPVFLPVIAVPGEKLESYTGSYSSPEISININIFVEDGILMGQGSGQPSFPLVATAENKFKFDPARLTMEFLPNEDRMIMVQGGATFEFTRE